MVWLFPNPRLFSDPVSLLDTALRLSGQRSISVHTDIYASADIWKYLSLHSYRWKGHPSRDGRLLRTSRCSAKRRPSCPREAYSQHDHACEALNASPRLTNLTLINDGGSVMTADLPWHQLTHLALLSRGTLPEVIHLLRLSPCLQVLEALGTQVQQSWTVPLEPISHPSLCRLQVSDITILQHLILPTLSDLDLVGATNEQGRADIICSLLSWSKSTLRKFKIVCGTSLHGLMNVLRATPKLTELTVEALEMEEGFVKDFFQAKDFLSSLQKVSFTVGNFIPSLEANTVLVDAMERRWGSAMRSCYISAPSIDWQIADDDAVRIKKMRGEGLDLMIIYANQRVL
ncbi:uncharacterized protein EV420DRAFT_977888 [Desarmillaria tabescens]|uniref:F-box domain-containing protein n=1 Tax=Armillaria tabescens TaxID=1929756 RepID=A0AA39MT90_ARMTA|nr:uncharacterized protein EV420DRAFT_977888 [Desarmillaria tabescens]KAK0444965.1 hypothetical protein EV420DRAFT_977888 [Desarmillaria tabescens]